jgi:hypothetical protein
MTVTTRKPSQTAYNRQIANSIKRDFLCIIILDKFEVIHFYTNTTVNYILQSVGSLQCNSQLIARYIISCEWLHFPTAVAVYSNMLFNKFAQNIAQ